MTYIFSKYLYLLTVGLIVYLLRSIFISRTNVNYILKDPPNIQKVQSSLYYKVLNQIFSFQTHLSSKKGDLHRIFIVFIFIFFVYSLFLSVLPGNENVLCFVNGLNECVSPNDGDGSLALCTAYGNCNPAGGTHWNIGGEGTGTCCGDDSATEWVKSSSYHASIESPPATSDACCNPSTDCVNSNTCYAQTATFDVDSSGDSDYCSSGTWVDCSTTAHCDPTGEFAEGESSDTCTTSTCNEACTTNDCIYKRYDGYPDCDINGGCVSNRCIQDTDYASTFIGIGMCDPSIGAICTGGASDSIDICVTSGSCLVDHDYDDAMNDCTPTDCIKSNGDTFDVDNDGDIDTCNSGTWQDCSIGDFGISSSYDSSIDGSPIASEQCCAVNNNCVHSNTCYADNDTSTDIDSDGDNDYCNSGTWYDCNTDSECSGQYICSILIDDCVNLYGNIAIRNFGTTRIENTSQEYTSSKEVVLLLDYSSDAISCRYTNYPNNNEIPSQDYIGWSNFESCIGSRLWKLSDGVGLKTVFYQVQYYAERNFTVNDTITYEFSGSGLDTTPPTAPIVYHANYTNINKSALIYWYNVSDPESTVLSIPLVYNVTLYTSTGTTLGSIQTTASFYNFSGFNLAHNTILYANISVINSASLKVNVTSSALTIDLQKPTINLLQGSLFNISKQTYLSLSGFNENIWVYATNANFTWNATDAISNQIVAYSYLLTTNLNQNPDNIPEGTIGNLYNTKTKSYSSLNSDKYYFFVIAKDLAGNWADPFSINFSIDNTPSSKPTILTETKAATSITYTWSQATDDESNVTMYRINLTDDENNPISHFNQTDTSNRSHTFSGLSTLNYNATVGALNGAGIWRWSNQEGIITDFDPPTIKATPNRTVVTLTPILRAWTNEQAVCYYNNSGNNVAFIYSNTTYHETKLNTLSNAHYRYTITCIDTSLNSGNLQINFTIDNSLSASTINGTNSFTTYENIIDSFTVNIYDNLINLTGVTQNRFSLQIDNVNKDVTIFDNGNGIFNVSFYTPTAGDYNLKLLIDNNIEKSITLTVNDLYMTAFYEDSNYPGQPETTKHSSYFTTSNRIGFATQYDINLNLLNQENETLNISKIKLDNSLFIFNTKLSNSFLEREKRLNNQNFLSVINPSFGYPINDIQLIRFMLGNNNYLMQSNINSLTDGQYILDLTKTTSGDVPMISFVKSETNSKTILVG